MELQRSSKTQNRVVVTGIGALTPLGNTLKETWKNALEGRSGIGPITKFDPAHFDVHFAGEIKNFDADAFVPKKEQKKMDLFIQYSLACTQMALEMAELKVTPEVSEKTGVLIGVGMGGLPSIEEQFQRLLEKGPGRISPFFIPMVITNLAAGQVSIAHGFKGPNYSVTSACASGAHSIGEAVRYIRDGICDVMLAGGAESTVCPMAIGGFAAMKALSTRNDAPEKASRPFDKNRDGFVLSEGAAMLVLESLEHATQRGANILAEVTGYGVSSDAYHMTSPAPDGSGAARAMRMALKDSSLHASAIGHINAHGTSTPMGDELETMAIKSVFGDHAKNLIVSSTKSMTGHTLGAAGAIESAMAIMALVDQKTPPTINLDEPSESCDLNYSAHKAQSHKFDHVLNNSFGFGGTNACVIFSKLKD